MENKRLPFLLLLITISAIPFFACQTTGNLYQIQIEDSGGRIIDVRQLHIPSEQFLLNKIFSTFQTARFEKEKYPEALFYSKIYLADFKNTSTLPVVQEIAVWSALFSILNLQTQYQYPYKEEYITMGYLKECLVLLDQCLSTGYKAPYFPSLQFLINKGFWHKEAFHSWLLFIFDSIQIDRPRRKLVFRQQKKLWEFSGDMQEKYPKWYDDTDCASFMEVLGS